MVNWGNALLVVVLGMGIVFIVLALIMLVLIIMEKVLAPKVNKDVKTAEKTETVQKAPETAPKRAVEAKTNGDGEIIAAITAAICASLNTSSYNIRIKSYRKLGESASAWNRASRNENVYKGF